MFCRERRIASILVTVILVVSSGYVAAQVEESPGALSVPVLVFAHAYDGQLKAPVDTASVFSADVGKVVCFTRVQGATSNSTVTHVWYHEGRTMAKVDLNIGSADWRTCSSKNIMPAWTGLWEVKVLDADGVVIADAGFKIQ